MDPSTVEHVARLARLELDTDTRNRLTLQLGSILEYFRRLEELDTEGIEPAVHPVSLPPRTRADVEADGPGHNALLRNTEHQRDGFYEVPRIIE